eukprot:1134059_1
MVSNEYCQTGCFCICALSLMVTGCIMIGFSIGNASKSPEIFASHEECLIMEFNSYHCRCTSSNCDDEQESMQYMYHAISDEICGNQTIRSTKDPCQMISSKETPYNIGDEIACYVEDCNGFFTIPKYQSLDDYVESQMLLGLGISMFFIAGFCCIAALISGSNDCFRASV